MLNLAAEKAGWGTPLPAGRARGVAVHESFGTVVAQVVEVSRKGDCVQGGARGLRGRLRHGGESEHRRDADGVRRSASDWPPRYTGAITIEGRRASKQSNFHDYPVLRINQMPAVEVHIVPSTDKPTGVGEPGTPPIAPAVANAIVALGGSPQRSLPFAKGGLTFG